MSVITYPCPKFKASYEITVRKRGPEYIMQNRGHLCRGIRIYSPVIDFLFISCYSWCNSYGTTTKYDKLTSLNVPLFKYYKLY